MRTVLFWFRRDFRITDNTALHAATTEARQVVPVYLLSKWNREHGWTGPNRQSFLCGSLRSLAGNLEAIGSKLIVRSGDAVPTLIKLAQACGADAIYANRDPDPFGKMVEAQLETVCAEAGIRLQLFDDAALHRPDEVLTGSGTMYRVYTPYSRNWMSLPKVQPTGRVRKLGSPATVDSDPLPSLETWGLCAAAGGVIEAGEKAARARMTAFLSGPILEYADKRNIPAGTTSSRLSQDLRFGLISIRELYAKCVEARDASATANQRKGVHTFIGELAWREFYFAILHHYPHVLDRDFNPDYAAVRWDEPGEDFERWKAGQTGFPIVDAAMRQLAETGFMHNRSRMIVAMFLTKDLHVHWWHGERYFMQTLVDGEIASNNGGWQWSAGTGADAAPYFRIQNPWTQSERFDVDGDYIKSWVPELRDQSSSRLHAAPLTPLAKGYPLPMLEHGKERQETLLRFKEAKR